MNDGDEAWCLLHQPPLVYCSDAAVAGWITLGVLATRQAWSRA